MHRMRSSSRRIIAVLSRNEGASQHVLVVLSFLLIAATLCCTPEFSSAMAEETRRPSTSGPQGTDPLTTEPAWTAEGGGYNAQFGTWVASAGDVNGDGYSDVVVGAPLYSNGQSEEGTAFLYLGSASGLAPTPAWVVESDQVVGFLGYSVATAGDVNGDGYSDVI